MIEVFKTNITTQETADNILAELQRLFPHAAINFDLEDCDNILRVKGDGVDMLHVRTLVRERGFICDELC